MNNLKQAFDKIIDSKLGLEAFLILYCLSKNNKQLLQSYTNQCKKINTEIFKKLIDDDYLKVINGDLNKIYWELLSLTEKGAEILQKMETPMEETKSLMSDSNFEEFRKFYPSVVKSGFRTRRLHSDLKRSKDFYDKLLMETTHDILCKAAKLYHNEMIRSNSEFYMQNLPTWLNQKNYKQYLEEINNLKNKEITTQTNDFTNLEAI